MKQDDRDALARVQRLCAGHGPRSPGEVNVAGKFCELFGDLSPDHTSSSPFTWMDEDLLRTTAAAFLRAAGIVHQLLPDAG